MQEANLMDPDQQRPANDANKFAMRNGMSFLFLILFEIFFWCNISISRSVSKSLRFSTHRQRTQNYIKTLEAEVIRLRGSESGLIQERDNLQGKLEILRATCQLAGIPLPPGIDKTHEALSQRAITRDSNMPATISMHEDTMSNQRLHVQWPGPYNHQFSLNGGSSDSPQPLSTLPSYSSPEPQPSLPNGIVSVQWLLGL